MSWERDYGRGGRPYVSGWNLHTGEFEYGILDEQAGDSFADMLRYAGIRVAAGIQIVGRSISLDTLVADKVLEFGPPLPPSESKESTETPEVAKEDTSGGLRDDFIDEVVRLSEARSAAKDELDYYKALGSSHVGNKLSETQNRLDARMWRCYEHYDTNRDDYAEYARQLAEAEGVRINICEQ